MKQTHIGRASDQTILESLSKKTLELLETAASIILLFIYRKDGIDNLFMIMEQELCLFSLRDI